MGLWLNLKRDKHYAVVYYKGEKILEIKVDEQNRGNVAFINLDAGPDVVFKVEREKSSDDESFGNQERFNR
jgi:mevalonate pyrophosphate decarboxylase